MDMKTRQLFQLCLILGCLKAGFTQSGCYDFKVEDDLGLITFKTRTWYSVSGNESDSGTKVLAHMEWNISDSGLKPDGFAVFFGEDSGSFSLNEKSLQPINICTRPGQFWVETGNQSACTNVTTGCPATTSECLCVAKCPLFYNRGRYCEGSVFVEMDGYISVPGSIRYLEFDVTPIVHKRFKSGIVPYSRQNSPFDSTKVDFQPLTCNDLVKTSSYREAVEQCCEIGLKDRVVRNITFGDPTLDFRESTVLMNMSWMLPLDQEGLLHFDIQLGFDWPASVVKPMNHTFLLYHGDQSQLASCQNHTHIYQITLVDLVPTTTFQLTITPRYAKQGSRNEGTVVTITVPAMNSCNQRYRYCDINSNCTAQDKTGFSSMNASCECHPGYSGDGINPFSVGFGSGCTDIDRCELEPSPCDSKARCHDNPAPLLTANCSCLSGYFGDGYVDGSGCSSINLYALAIALPVTVVLLILIIGVAWMIRTRKLRQENLKWSNFVANTALQYSIPSTNKDQGVWIPTFGDKWEVARERINLGEILGRGNYGVVYKGVLTPLQKDEVGKELEIAVKFVKEGANVEEKISDFLTEIGFMLNVGEHPNVIKVLGCSTTQKPILLVTEFLEYGDLLHFLWDSREPTKCLVDPIYHLTETSVYNMARQVAQGMAYLTRSRIIHGDLAARNILIGEGLVCKISDFGLANDVYRYGVIRGQTERTVPFKWISPERMMSGKVPITSKSDVWSFGNLMYEMITLGCMPHPGVSSDELFDKLKTGYRMKQPASCGDKMFGIMKRCWRWKASSRPTFADLVSLLVHDVDDKEPVEYVNIVKVVDNIDKEQYDNELDKETQKTSESKEEEVKYKSNLTYYNKALMGDDMEKREFDKITDF